MSNRLPFSFRTVTMSGEVLPELLEQPLLVFSRLSGIEGIHSLFEDDLELKTLDSCNVLYSPAADFDMEAMQGKELTVSIELDGSGTGLAGGFGLGKREIAGLVTDKHSNGHHRMVLTDGNGAFQNIPSPAYHTISWYPSSDRVDEEHLYHFEAHDRRVTGKWAHGDHDFKQPRADLNVSADDPRDTIHANHELYAWPGDHAEPMAGSDARAEGDMLARIRMEAIRQHGHRVRGKGNVRSMAAGHTFTLSRFLRKKANCEYLIFDTRLLIEDVGEFAGSGQQWRCEVEFEAQPTREIFRPEWLLAKLKITVTVPQYGSSTSGFWAIFLPGDRVKIIVADGNASGHNDVNVRPADDDPFVAQGVRDDAQIKELKERYR